jgi:hypothetical protein
MPAVIKVEDLSKAYQLGEIGTGTHFPRPGALIGQKYVAKKTLF